MPATNPAWKEFVEQVRARSNIADVANLEKAEKSGHAIKGLSPLRAEKTPSFYVYPDEGNWFDFGTSEHGDVFELVMKRDRKSFSEAVHALAELAGLKWEGGRGAEDPAFQRELDDLIESRRIERVLTEVVGIMHQHLPTRVRQYLREHYGQSDRIIDHLKVGYAVAGLWELLTDPAAGYRYDAQDLLATGLFTAGRHGCFDHRIIFPYWKNGVVKYVIGRLFDRPDATHEDWEKSKYRKLLTHSDKNPHVSKTIENAWFYNEDVFRRRLDYVVITEGVTDCISLMQAEVPATSPVTTAPRDRDMPRLAKLVETVPVVYIVNDNDELADGQRPGEKGAEKVAAYLFGAGKDVRIGVLPKASGVTKIDVNEFLVAASKRDQEPKAAFEAVLKEALPYPEFLIRRLGPSTILRQTTDQLEPICKMIAHLGEIERDGYARSMAKQCKIPKAAVVMMVKAARSAFEVEKGDAAPAPSKRVRDTSDEKLRGSVNEDVGYYYVDTATGTEKISSFTLTLKKLVHTAAGANLICADIRLESGDLLETDYVFPATAFYGKREFIRALPSPRMQWTGTDDEVQGLKRLLMAQAPNVRHIQGTSVIGYHETAGGPRYVTPQGTMGPDGWIDDPDIQWMTQGDAISTRVKFERVSDDETMQLARKALPLVMAVNAPAVTVALAGLCFASAFTPRIRAELGHFPIGNVNGSHGSGKTSVTTRVFWRLQGVVTENPFTCMASAFILMLNASATNTIWVPYDEFKPQDMGNRAVPFQRFLRGVYSGETDQRGRADQSSAFYSLEAPHIVMGEAPIEGDPALDERVVPISPSRNYLDRHPEAVAAYRALEAMPLHRLAPAYAMWTMRQDFDDLLARARQLTQDTLSRGGLKVPQRVSDNLVVVSLGMVALDKWATELGAEMQPIDYLPAFSIIAREIVNGGEGAHVKDAFDHLIEQLSVMAHQGLLREGVNYAHISELLHIHLASCLPLYASWRRQQGVDERPLSERALHRILKEKVERGDSYVVDAARRALLSRVGGIGDASELFARCVAVDLAKLGPDLNVQAFPITRHRTHGGGSRWGGSDD